MEDIPDLCQEEHANGNREPEAKTDKPAHDGTNVAVIPTLFKAEKRDSNADHTDDQGDQPNVAAFGVSYIRTHSIKIPALCVVRRSALQHSRFASAGARGRRERSTMPLRVKCGH